MGLGMFRLIVIGGIVGPLLWACPASAQSSCASLYDALQCLNGGEAYKVSNGPSPPAELIDARPLIAVSVKPPMTISEAVARSRRQ